MAIDQGVTAFVPFEDIAVIVLDHREISLTHPVLAACGEYGISLFATGDNHQPNGVFTAFLGHSRATKMLRLQLALGRPTAKRAWAAIVRRKIENQAHCVELAYGGNEDRLRSYARRVRSGDVGRMEALAAGYYFPRLFGRNFDRSQSVWINAALDYGYAVVRGAIARSLVTHGLLPSLGLAHASEQNAFNLADDLIEPFRPVVDLHVAKASRALDRGVEELSPADKVALVALLNVDVAMPRGEMSVLAAIEHASESLARVYEDAGDMPLELPRLMGLRQHAVEM